MEKKQTFEEKMKELETIITSLENGEFTLNEAIEEYTKAMKLVRDCDAELKSVEERISKIVKETEEDFNIEE